MYGRYVKAYRPTPEKNSLGCLTVTVEQLFRSGLTKEENIFLARVQLGAIDSYLPDRLDPVPLVEASAGLTWRRF